MGKCLASLMLEVTVQDIIRDVLYSCMCLVSVMSCPIRMRLTLVFRIDNYRAPPLRETGVSERGGRV